MATASKIYVRLLCATCVLMTLAAASDHTHRSVSRRIRLSLGSGPASLIITWATDGTEIGRAACVQWYIHSAAEGDVAKGQHQQQQLATATEESEDRVLCRSNASVPFFDLGANETTQVIHSLTLQDLPEESLDISYRVAVVTGSLQLSVATTWSEWHSTRTPVSRVASQTRLLMFGDLGLYNAPARPYLINDAVTGFDGLPYDAALHVGDIAYDLHSLEGKRSSQFLESVEPLTSRLPYMVAPGNHEAWYNFSHYKELFRMPGHTGGLYYSFDVGPAHIVVYNTEAFFWPDWFDEGYMRQMWEWLDRDLEEANGNRQARPWIIVAGHRPMYCARPHLVTGLCGNEALASQWGIPSVCPHNNPFLCRPVHKEDKTRFPIESLFHRHGVDLAVYGHIHDYERYLPVFNYSSAASSRVSTASSSPPWRYVAPRATVHITAGGAGNSEMKKGDCLPNKGPCDEQAPWCTFQSGFAPEGCESSDHSFGRLAIYNATHLRWQHWSYSFRSVEDEWWIIQPFHGSFT